MTPRTAALLAAVALVGLGGWAALMVGIPPIAITAGGVVVVAWTAARLRGRRPAGVVQEEPGPAPHEPAGS